MKDKAYMIDNISARLDTVHVQYRMYCSGQNELCEALTYGSAAVMRSHAKKDIQMLQCMYEMAVGLNEDFNLSEEAFKGFERIVAPYERHRNYRG